MSPAPEGTLRPATGLFCAWCNAPHDGTTWVNTRYLALSVPVCFDSECIDGARADDVLVAKLAESTGNHKDGVRNQ